MTVLLLGGLGTLATAFALAASRAGARLILADLLVQVSPREGGGDSGHPAGPTAAPPAGEVSNADPERRAREASRTARPSDVPVDPEGIARGRFGPRAAEAIARYRDAGVAIPPVYSVDVTDAAALSAFEKTLSGAERKGAGPIDVIVNFAGLHHRPFDLVKDDPQELAALFRRVVEINLTGAFLVTAFGARLMVPQRRGQIIHLCSSGSRLSLYGSYAYNASKHGVEGLVKTAATQLAPFGVRVNGVAPGTVITDLNRSLSFDEEGRPRPRARSILAHTPTKRFATAEGVAETILAMCVPQRHFTGNVVFCDDGYNVEGHSWPEGNVALYGAPGDLEALEEELDRRYPRAGSDRPAAPERL